MESVTKSLFHQKCYFDSFMEIVIYEGWNFNSGNYLFTTDKK